MKICVCLKIVPDRASLSYDAETGAILRSAAASCIDPAALVALEAACALRAKCGGTADGVCMGPSFAQDALKKAFYSGADALFLLSSPAFAGADVPATAHALAGFFKARDYDLILCGKASSDGNTGQLGGVLSGVLGLPYAGCVCALGAAEGNALTALQRMDGTAASLRVPLPALLTLEADAAEPRTPTLTDTLRARGKCVQLLDAAALPGTDLARCGARGSKTRVSRITVTPRRKKTRFFTPETLNTLAALLAAEREEARHGT